MQTQDAQRNIESTFIGKKRKFKIEASAKAFQILSSNLYSDKPLAIIRELSCNALDSHWDAKQEKPFKMTLPSAINPTFELRDYGTGMSPEKTEKLYSTFFASDKNGTNDAIGGLGLGSKSPFSYTDTFTLISYWHGVKHTWLCMLDEDGEPATQKVSEEPSDETSGIQYIIPVKTEDFSSFRTRAQKVLKYFPVDAYEVNCDVFPVEYAIQNEVYAIRNDAPYGEKHLNIIMGPVAYKIQKGALPDEISGKYSSLFRDKPFDIFCKIGDIDVQPSREALSYDKRSSQEIAQVLETVAHRIKADIEKELVACTTYLEACEKAEELGAYYSSRSSALKWRSRTTEATFDCAGSDLVNYSDITDGNALRLKYNAYFHLRLSQVVGAQLVYYDSSIPLNNLRLKHHLTENSDTFFHVYRDMDALLEHMWNIEVFDYIDAEDLPVPVREKTIRDGRPLRSVPVKLKKRVVGSAWSALKETVEEINARDNVCWAPLEGNGNEPWAKSSHSSMHVALCGLDSDITFIGIPKSLMHKVKLFTIPDIETMLRWKLIEFIDTEKRYAAAFIARSEIDWMRDLALHAPRKWNHLEVYQYAQLYNEGTHILRAYKDVAKKLNWDTEKQFSYITESKYLKKYKIFEALDNLYTNQSVFVNNVFELTDAGEKDGVHNQQQISDDNRE